MQPTRFTDADELVLGQPQVWTTSEAGGGEMVSGSGLGETGAPSPGSGGETPGVSPQAAIPLVHGGLSGSPQPASRATPPANASSYHHGHNNYSRGGPSPYSAHLYTTNPRQLPSVETIFPLQQQQHHEYNEHHQHQHLQQQHHQHHHQEHSHHYGQQQHSFQDFSSYRSPPPGEDSGQLSGLSPPGGSQYEGGPSPGGYPHGPVTYTHSPPISAPSCSSHPSSCVQVIVSNPHRVKEERDYQDRSPLHCGDDSGWDGVAYARVPPGVSVKTDPELSMSPPALQHSPGSTATTSRRKPHPRQGYRRPTNGDPRKEKRREQNRRAALKCRLKKKGEWDLLHQDYGRLQNENADLQQRIDMLQEEKRKLCEVLRSHQQTCALKVDLPPMSP